MASLPSQTVRVAIAEAVGPPSAIMQLDRHQTRIRATLGRAADILAQDVPDTFTLALLRWQALRELREYQLFKHHTLFDPVIRRNGADAARIVTMKANCIALGERVVAHVLNWSGQSVATRWSTYAAEVQALLRALELHMRTERAECLRLNFLSGVQATAPSIGEDKWRFSRIGTQESNIWQRAIAEVS